MKIQGETCYLWQAVDHEGEVLESYVSKRRDRNAALKFLRKVMERYGGPEIVVTENLGSYHETISRSKSTVPISLSGFKSMAHDD